jgi:putative oxidoreductase
MDINIVLWAVQIVLSLKFLSVAYTHGLRTDQTKMQQGIERLGPGARPLLSFIALCALLGAVGLIIPVATGIMTWLIPWVAALLALMMLLSIGFHVRCRETPHIVVSLILFALAAFVAYGRWVIAPF